MLVMYHLTKVLIMSFLSCLMIYYLGVLFYMSDFNKSIIVILNNEGGYSNDKYDPGGETKYGISKRSYPDIDIKNLTEEQAIHIYYDDFWLANKLNQINDDTIATKIFDMTVNMGSERAAKIVQQSLNYCGYSVVQDGIIGQDTIAGINSIDPNTFHQTLIKMSISFYEKLVQDNPKMKVFLEDWLNRAKQ